MTMRARIFEKVVHPWIDQEFLRENCEPGNERSFNEKGRRFVAVPAAPDASIWKCGWEGCGQTFRNVQGLRSHEKLCRGQGPVVPIGPLPDAQIISSEKRSPKTRRSSRLSLKKLVKSQKMTKGSAKRTSWGFAKMAACIHLCDEVGALEASKQMQIPCSRMFEIAVAFFK